MSGLSGFQGRLVNLLEHFFSSHLQKDIFYYCLSLRQSVIKYLKNKEYIKSDSKGSNVLNKYSSYDGEFVLQMACQEKDTESLKALQTELW